MLHRCLSAACRAVRQAEIAVHVSFSFKGGNGFRRQAPTPEYGLQILYLVLTVPV